MTVTVPLPIAVTLGNSLTSYSLISVASLAGSGVLSHVRAPLLVA